MNVALPGDDRAAFAAAIEQLTNAAPQNDLCGPFTGAADVSGAVISTLGAPLGSQTVCASSATAAWIDEIQIDLGEGPCWEAMRTRRPVLESDLRSSNGEGWPAAHEALRALDIGALYAFPMFVGDIDVGSVDLYNDAPQRLSRRTIHDVSTLTEIASRHVLRRALDDLGSLDDLGTVDAGMIGGRYSRREMHQASGMVAAQLSIGVDEALVFIRGHAFSAGRSVAAVSADIVARRLTFPSPDDGSVSPRPPEGP